MPTKPFLMFKDLASKLTGFSTPFFGISWQPPETERKIANSVVIFLEDRRVLYNPTEMELPYRCMSSINEIRHFFTETLAELNQKSELAKNLKTMRAACRKFLDTTQSLDNGRVLSLSHTSYNGWIFLSALGELRGTFGMCLSQIVLAYGLNVEEDLATILPASDEN
jgi:hypothetical protein